MSHASYAGPLLASLGDIAIEVGDRSLSGEALAGAVGGVATALAGLHRVAVWATPTLDTCVAVAGAIAAGATAVPLDPRAAPAELVHLVEDSHPQAVLAADTEVLPSPVGGLPRIAPLDASPASPPAEPSDPEVAALLVYTSGTTGPPKGAVLSRRALASCLDGLADAWAWNADDVLVHGLPLFHVHGLVLGVLGPLRIGSSLRHVGRFSPDAVSDAVVRGGTVVFGVPTMWSRIASSPSAASLRSARLLVSGSAGLPRPVYDALASATGQGPVERYGMTETLIVAAARSDRPRAPGSVGAALASVELRLVDVEDGIGELEVRGPTLFSGYLHRPEATTSAYDEDWFRTGDMATYGDDGGLRIVGRRATDLVKTGGHRVGAGEVEGALLAHPAVSEAAVIGLPDDDLGERIVAYVVCASPVSEGDLSEHAASVLTPYKQPREYRIVEALPRNAMGKVLKHVLRGQ